MLRAAPPGHPLQKPTVVQWDIGGMLNADGAADESVSPQSGISRLELVLQRQTLIHRCHPATQAEGSEHLRAAPTTVGRLLRAPGSKL